MDRSMSKLEEALEIKALRRVISAYLNYSVAAEEDVKRWERSYAKLRHSHKDVLAHLPKKHEALKRCISVNSFFILNMLQAFEPPFDMSHGDDILNSESIHEHYERDRCAWDEHVDLSVMDTCCNASATGVSDGRLSNGFAQVREDARNFENTAQAEEDRNDLCAADKASTESKVCNEKKNVDLWEGRSSKDSESHHNQCAEHDDAGTRNFPDKNVSNGCVNYQLESQAGENSSNNPHASNLEVIVGGIDWQHPSLQLNVPPADVDKVRCIIRNIVRDWAEEGAIEREQCYKPILEELEHYFPHRSQKRPPSCLVPGAGLARLACEISRLGFVSQGNEFSYYMLICSSFILNHTQSPLEWVIHPWIHSNCNIVSSDDQLRPVYFPDLHPGSAGITEGFSMCAGDFVEVYSHPSQIGTWDAVATCFFIDTAHNIVEYIEIISRILKPGGVWINLGPLLYHFADALSYSPEEEMSVELSLEDVKEVASRYGLKLQKEKTIETTYTANQRSMMQNRYFAAFWTMKKDGDGLHSKNDILQEQSSVN